MPATESRRTPEELARLGGQIFDQQVQPALKPTDNGKFVAIDVDVGDYEIDEDDYTAVLRLKSRSPDAEVWLARAGFPTTYQM